MSLKSLFTPAQRPTDDDTRTFVDDMRVRLRSMPLEQMVTDRIRRLPNCTLSVGLCPDTYVPDVPWASAELTQFVRKRLGDQFSVQIADYGSISADRQRSMSVELVAQRPHGGYNLF